jgi:hypothetical protein
MSGEKALFDFKKDYKDVKVFKGDGTSDVYYTKDGGSVTATGLKFNEQTGTYQDGAGDTVLSKEAEKRISSLI